MDELSNVLIKEHTTNDLELKRYLVRKILVFFFIFLFLNQHFSFFEKCYSIREKKRRMQDDN